MRDYNYRRKAKIKEQERKEFLIKNFYHPCLINRDYSKGYFFRKSYTDIKRAGYKHVKFYKGHANKITRRKNSDFLGNGSLYKREFDIENGVFRGFY